MSLQKNRSAVRRYAKAMKFGAWIQGIPNKVTPPPFRLLQIGSLFWQSRVLYVAAALDIATTLSDQTLSYQAIATKVAAAPDATHRLLRMLAAMGVFEQSAPGHFKNNKTSDYLREDRAENVRAMILMHNSEEMSRPWYEGLLAGVKSGEPPFRLTHGCDLFDYMDEHPEFDALFSKAMGCVDVLTGDAFVTDFDWGRFGRIIDIGGSKGSKSAAILKQHPHMEALIFDRPQVIREAQEYWSGHEDSSLRARIAFHAGDIFSAIPRARSDNDIYLLSGVLHGFDDDACIGVLGSLAEAAAGTAARIALLEMVVDESEVDLSTASFDLQMFMGTAGRERTLNEWLRLFDASGLMLKEVVSLRTFAKILVLQAPAG